MSLATGLDAGRGRCCDSAIAASAFSSLSNRADGSINAEVGLVTGSRIAAQVLSKAPVSVVVSVAAD